MEFNKILSTCSGNLNKAKCEQCKQNLIFNVIIIIVIMYWYVLQIFQNCADMDR